MISLFQSLGDRTAVDQCTSNGMRNGAAAQQAQYDHQRDLPRSVGQAVADEGCDGERTASEQVDEGDTVQPIERRAQCEET